MPLPYATAVLVVYILSIVAWAWAFYGDRPRGRLRCPKCWYSMADLDTLRCPECGHKASKAKSLLRPRRRRKTLVCAGTTFIVVSLFTAGLFAASSPRIDRYGWGHILPASVLVVALRFSDEDWILKGLDYHTSHTLAGHEYHMFSPYVEDAMWSWQWAMLGERLLGHFDEPDEISADSRRTIYRVLGRTMRSTGDAEIRTRVTDTLKEHAEHPSHDVQFNVLMHGVPYMPSDEAIEYLRRFLDHEHINVRSAALGGLYNVANRSDAPLPALIDALSSEHGDVRSGAASMIRLLARRGRDVSDAYDKLWRLEGDPDDVLREWIFRFITSTIYGSQPDEVDSLIRRGLESDDLYERRGAVKALYYAYPGDLDPFAPYLVRAIADDDTRVRGYAKSVLRDVDDGTLAQHRAFLESATDHPDQVVSRLAARLLERLDN